MFSITFSFGKCTQKYILQSKMFSTATMVAKKQLPKALHLMLPLHFVGAKMDLMLNIFQRKMFSVHFPLENVQLCKNAVFFALQKTKMRTFCWCKNAFDAYILCNKMLQMHFCNAYIFQRKMFSVHFPKENVQLCKNAFDAKMHLMPKCI